MCRNMPTGFQRFSLQISLCLFICKESFGQTYTISGSSPYAVKGEIYRFTCNIVGGSLPAGLKFTRDSADYCSIFLLTCSANSANCGCVNNNNRTLYLNIPDVKTTDEGGWRCGSNIQGSGVSNTITLPVYYGPENIRLDRVGSNIIVREGTSKTVTCSADCKPTCSFIWLKRGSSVPSIGSQLTLNNRNQAGMYTCQAQHPNITNNRVNSTVITATVYFGPDDIKFNLVGSSISVIEGLSQDINCSAICNPSCSIKWYTETQQASSTGILSFTEIHRNQDGIYSCRVENTQIQNSLKTKTLNVNVSYPPSITSLTSTNREASEGSSVTFTCIVESRPASTITWSSSVNTNIASGTVYTNPDVSCLDTETYTCSANNGVGSVSKSIPLFVKCSPRLRDGIPSEVNNRIGQRVILEVDVLAYPEPTFSWRHNNTVVESTIVKLSANNYVSTVDIILESSSFGVYTVNVKNDVGENMFYILVGDEATTISPPVTECTTSIVVGCIVAFIVGVCCGVVGVVIYLKRINCKQTKKNFDTAAVTYDVVGPRDVNNYDGINMTETTDTQPSNSINQTISPPVSSIDSINQTSGGSNHEHSQTSNTDSIRQTTGDAHSNQINTYEHLTPAYNNENSYETF